jgi:hypothetical protein
MKRISTISGILLFISYVSLCQNKNRSYEYFPGYSLYGGISFGFLIDFVIPDFNEFDDIIGTHNTDLMNENFVTVGFELAGWYRRYIFAFRFGSMDPSIATLDSMNLNSTPTFYGLNLRYNFIDSRRFIFQPEFALRWHRYRLINSYSEWKIPFDQYMSDKTLDIRFNQAVGTLGLSIVYKLYVPDIEGGRGSYASVSLYCGYVFKLSDTPWIYSSSNRLLADTRIGFSKLNISPLFSFYYFF